MTAVRGDYTLDEVEETLEEIRHELGFLQDNPDSLGGNCGHRWWPAIDAMLDNVDTIQGGLLWLSRAAKKP